MTNKSNVYLPLHVWDRELDSRIVIAYLLACKGHRCFIGHEYNIAPLYQIDRSAVLFRAGGPLDHQIRGSWHKNISEHGGIVITHDEEGINNLPIKFKPIPGELQEVHLDLNKIKKNVNKCSIKAMKDVSEQIAWSDLHRAILCHSIENIEARSVAVNRIESLSSVRFDLLGDFGEIYQKRMVDAIHNIFEDYILVLDNFAVDNRGQTGIIDPSDDLRQAGYSENQIKELKQETEENRKIESKSREDFGNLIIEFAREHPAINIVFRPHPVLNPRYWEEKFSNYKNITVVEKGPIHAWIYGAIATIHSGCTTGLEAYAAQRPTFDVSGLINQRCNAIKSSLIAQSQKQITSRELFKKKLKDLWKEKNLKKEVKAKSTITTQDNKSKSNKLSDKASQLVVDNALSVLQQNSKIVGENIHTKLGIINPEDIIGTKSALSYIVNVSNRLLPLSKNYIDLSVAEQIVKNNIPNQGKSRYSSINEIQKRLEDARYAFQRNGLDLHYVKVKRIGVNVFIIYSE